MGYIHPAVSEICDPQSLDPICGKFDKFLAHGSFQAGVRKPQIRVKIGDFFPVWPWNLTDDLEKQKGTSSMLLEAVCMISLPYVNSNWG